MMDCHKHESHRCCQYIPPMKLRGPGCVSHCLEKEQPTGSRLGVAAVFVSRVRRPSHALKGRGSSLLSGRTVNVPLFSLPLFLLWMGGARSTQAVQGGTKTQFYLRFGFDNRESRHDFRESILILAVLLNEGQIGGKHFGCAPLFT